MPTILGDTPPPDRRTHGRSGARRTGLFDRKLTPGVALVFFLALAVMCAAAAGIGYVSRELRHHVETRR